MYKRQPLSKAQIIAYHILDSVSSARRIVALSASLGNDNNSQWQEPLERMLEDSAGLEQLEQLMRGVRSPHTDTRSALLAISQLGDLLKDISVWPQVENILLAQTFCWPLLVSGDGENGLGISLPIAVDITLDGKGDVVVDGVQPQSDNLGGVDASQWRQHLERSVEAAKKLWLGKHGNHGVYESWWRNPADFRCKVKHASVTFDFHWANCILGDIPASFRDGSANTYFAMVVLARFLGRRRGFSSVVTGLIREQCKNKDSQEEELDFWVEPPGGVATKLRYLFAARTFERAALPRGSATENAVEGLLLRQESIENNPSARGTKIAQTAEVAYGAKLSHLADIVQIGGWRQYRFIRCPELQWAIHEDHHAQRPGLLDIADPRVETVLNLLGDNSAPVLDLQDCPEAIPHALGSALWHINMSLRLQMPRRIAMFSSLFIRATHDQQDSRFWEIVWRAIGAPAADFVRLHRAPSPAHAATELAEALSRFQPLESSPGHRAPDLIVIIGAERLSESLENTGNPLLRNLAVVPVLNELTAQGKLRIAPNAEALAAFLGRTRIILLRDRPDDEIDSLFSRAALAELNQGELSALSALSTFRWEFTHAMAALLLATAGMENLKSE